MYINKAMQIRAVCDNIKAPTRYVIQPKSIHAKLHTDIDKILDELKNEMIDIFAKKIESKTSSPIEKKLINTEEFEKIYGISKKQQARMRGLRGKRRLPFQQAGENSKIYYSIEEIEEYFKNNGYR